MILECYVYNEVKEKVGVDLKRLGIVDRCLNGQGIGIKRNFFGGVFMEVICLIQVVVEMQLVNMSNMSFF